MKKSGEGNIATLEEEARVFFVSITRARKKLHVIYPKCKNTQTIEPSIFYNRLFNITNPSDQLYRDIKNKCDKKIPIIKIGEHLQHKSWGRCKVIDNKDDIITIELIYVEIKKISATTCFKNRIVELVNKL